jgi:hypothetical protein
VNGRPKTSKFLVSGRRNGAIVRSTKGKSIVKDKDKEQPKPARPILNLTIKKSPDLAPKVVTLKIDKSAQTVTLLVQSISAKELDQAVHDEPSFLDLLRRCKAPAAAYRPKDEDLRQLHANVRMAQEAVNAAPNREALVKALHGSIDLQTQWPTVDLLLYRLGSYDLSKGENGKVTDAFFWARDRGVQAYLHKHRITCDKTSETLESLGGVDATYRLWCDEKKEEKGIQVVRHPRITLEKAALKKAPKLRPGEHICIEAQLIKRGKLKFVGIHKCVPEVDGEIIPDAVVPAASTHMSMPTAPVAGLIEGH